ncbi:MAG: restriction endonuclease [Ignavibacterium sp.]|jgi:type II restriction enzyme|uniref:DpnI domain-containing protein n=1 Tax=Ignavibacterium sp. TaxID=2651167 RepID=UPI003298BD4A
MDLKLNLNIARLYKSNPQKIRIVTESWVKRNGYCPGCGKELIEFENNKPVADFYCIDCEEEFELKSKNAKNVVNKIVNGAYEKMIQRITSEHNPSFFLLTYNNTTLEVNNFLIIPRFYFLPEIIERRNPLSPTARRAGWVGCNILLNEIPKNGRIYFVKNSSIIDKTRVLENWHKSSFLKTKKGETKGWILDVMNCIDSINKDVFYLDDLYKYEKRLKDKHPNNNFIRDKIRQQLQILRDKGIIEFLGRGKYRKVIL